MQLGVRMKILYLVIASRKRPWNAIQKAQNRTWVQSLGADDQLFYIFGDGSLGKSSRYFKDFHSTFLPKLGIEQRNENIQPLVHKGERVLVFRSKEGYDQLLTNTLSAIKFALENEHFDYIVRTNSSTFWIPANVRSVLEHNRESNLYAGASSEHQNIPYVAGYGIIFSRDTAQFLVKNAKAIDARIIDDVAIGKILSDENFKIEDIPIGWIPSPWKIKNWRREAILESMALRCKSEFRILPIRISRRVERCSFLPKFILRFDALTMKKLHAIVLKVEK